MGPVGRGAAFGGVAVLVFPVGLEEVLPHLVSHYQRGCPQNLRPCPCCVSFAAENLILRPVRRDSRSLSHPSSVGRSLHVGEDYPRPTSKAVL